MSTDGTIYLLHFDEPYVHAHHYLGWTAGDDVTHRLAEHAAGRGARLLAVVASAGIGWRLARTWPGTRARERQLKRQRGFSRLCPLCGVVPTTQEDRDRLATLPALYPNFTHPDPEERST